MYIQREMCGVEVLGTITTIRVCVSVVNDPRLYEHLFSLYL